MRGQNTTIRPETDADHDSIQHVNREAFGQDAEGQLVDAATDIAEDQLRPYRFNLTP